MKSLLLVSALLATACTPLPATQPKGRPVGEVRLSAERVSTNAIRLALDNGAPHRIGYNLCTSELQRRSGSGWTPVPSDEVCTMQLLTLNPGRDATFEKRVPGGLTPGQYRYVTSVENPLGTPQASIATEPFSL